MGDASEPLLQPVTPGVPSTSVASGAAFDEILGYTFAHPNVMLRSCFLRGGRWAGFDTHSEAEFLVDIAIWLPGPSSGEPQFDAVRLELDGLAEWLVSTGIEFAEPITPTEGFVRYSVRDDLNVECNEGISLVISSPIQFAPTQFPITEVRLSAVPYVEIKCGPPRTFAELRTTIRNVMYFFALALDGPIAITSVKGRLSDERDSADGPPSWAPIYCEFARWNEPFSSRLWSDYLFSLPDVQSDLQERLSGWLEMCALYEPAMHLYFASQSAPSQFADTQVLWLAQGLEVLHRRTCSANRMPTDEFESIKSQMLKNCPPEHRNSIGGRLEFANEFTLRNRLNMLVAPFRDWIEHPREFVDSIVQTRNHLTHFTGHRPEELEHPFNLAQVRGNLYGLFQLTLLRQLGFPHGEIRQLATRNPRLRRRLGISID